MMAADWPSLERLGLMKVSLTGDALRLLAKSNNPQLKVIDLQ
jgi:hypothetical protein